MVRSIPAPAGEPRASSTPPPPTKVYPRACGGTEHFGGPVPTLLGLSPRLRGNLDNQDAEVAILGSIPAPAGEPRQSGRRGCDTMVYPRACGGTKRSSSVPMRSWGLSPRLRGNPLRLPRRRTAGRSIPAPAGEPPSSRTSSSDTMVYGSPAPAGEPLSCKARTSV